jgi:hypothetical protein
MPTIEVSRKLVKSPPELWADLEGGRLSEAVGEVTTRATEPERRLAWEAEGVHGTAVLEPSGWSTRVTITAEIEQAVAQDGIWSRLRARRPEPSPHDGLEDRLHELLDHLGMAHRRPFADH